MQCSTFCFSTSSYSSITIFVLPRTFLFPLPLPYFGYCGVRSSQALPKSEIVPLPLFNSEFPFIVENVMMWWCDDCRLRPWLVLLSLSSRITMLLRPWELRLPSRLAFHACATIYLFLSACTHSCDFPSLWYWGCNFSLRTSLILSFQMVLYTLVFPMTYCRMRIV